MDAHVLEARKRSATGGQAARAARRAGYVPAVVYGPAVPAQPIEISQRELDRMVRHEAGANTLVQLALEGESEPVLALVKDIQRQPVSKAIVHLDLHAVRLDQSVEVTVAIEFTGEPAGLLQGGVAQYARREVDVSCLPMGIPASLTVDISHLGLHQHLTAGEVTLPADVVLVTDPHETLVSVNLPTVAAEPEEAEEAEEAEAGETDVAKEGGAGDE